MPTDIIVETSVNQTRIGVVEDQKLVELYIDIEMKQKTVGNIYRGVVKKILPGIQAAFVDIGQEKNGFIYLKELEETLSKEGNVRRLKEGDYITVQIEKEAMGTKGPKLTSHISIPGKYIVFIPRENSIGISKKIDNEEERNRLKSIFEKYKPKNCGIIVRTECVGKEEEEIIREIQFLAMLWESIEKKEQYVTAPVLLYKEVSSALKIARDLLSSKIRHYIVNDINLYHEVRNFINEISPELTEKIQYKDEEHLFQYFLIESQIDKALQRHIWLKSGGMIIIDHTEALTVIDVNTAKFVGKKNMEKTILKTNIEAAQEIARQIRLRNIGGIIIIDFIDMKAEEDKKMVLNVLSQELKKDRVPTTVLGITKLGLVEMTRKKTGPSLTSLLFNRCPRCDGRGMTPSIKYIGDHIEKEIDFIFSHTIYTKIIIEANKEIIEWFHLNGYKEALEKKYNKSISFIENNTLTNENYKIIKEK